MSSELVRPAGSTPGPWRWWTSNSWRRLSSDHPDHPRDGGVLCPTVSRSDGHPDCIVTEADMAMIAAVPDLYAALARLMPFMDESNMKGETEWERAVIAARAALAKAENHDA